MFGISSPAIGATMRLKDRVEMLIRHGLMALLMVAMLPVVMPAPTEAAEQVSALASPPPLALRAPRSLSRHEEAALQPMDHFRECEHCPEISVIPRGTFVMGASATEAGSTPDERPQHEVTIERFGVGQSPITVEQWNACVAASGCSYRPSEEATNGQMPVGNLSWDDAEEYVQWLSHLTGRPYRLLSEAEREYVTRAGTTTAFWWGDSTSPPSATGVVLPESPEPNAMQETALVQSGSPGPNPWGLREVHGGTYDWVEDCWHENYEGAPSDGSAWISEDCRGHVLRGGAIGRSPQTRRSAARLWFGPLNRLQYMGVRVARVLVQ
jgi:formylglycine-generating enzyme required for sulfatase activity